ncbi:MAG TPA: hypothetical protein ENN39_03500 [Desulfonatronum sp.]|nr:hypothetical protein [Desulfonatronum sp.]
MTNPCAPAPLQPFPDKSTGSPQAALFAALYQTMHLCPSGRRSPILDLLETRLGSLYDDLNKKFSMLLDAPSMSLEDKIYGLWLLYLSFIVFPRHMPGVQFWLGADLFSDDQHECLRIRGPATALPESRALELDLSILAKAVNQKVMAKVRLVAPDQLSVSIGEHHAA